VDFRTALQQRGFGVERFADDEQLIDALVNSHTNYQRISGSLPHYQAAMQQMQQLAPHWDEIKALLESKAQKAQQPPEPEKPYWEPAPEWDEKWESYLTVDSETGQIVPKDPRVTSPDLVQKYQQRRDWERAALKKLLADPAAAVLPGIEKQIMAKVEEAMAGQFSRRQEEQFANNFVLANQDVFYEKDSQGRTLTDPMTGAPVLTPLAQSFGQWDQMLFAGGLRDATVRAQVAMSMAMASANTAPGQPAAPPLTSAATPEAVSGNGDVHKQNFISAATSGAQRAPNRGGSLARGAAAVPQNPDLSFDQLLRQNARQRGFNV
jgi:hypothetical protein